MKKFLLTLIISTYLASCASVEMRKDEVTECYFPDSKSEKAPTWVCTERLRDLVVSAVGYSPNSAGGFSFMEIQATNQARLKLAAQIKTEINSLVKDYVDAATENNVEVYKTITNSLNQFFTDQSLSGSRIMQKAYSKNGVFILVGIDEENFDALTKQLVKKSIQSEPQKWESAMEGKSPEAVAEQIVKEKE